MRLFDFKVLLIQVIPYENQPKVIAEDQSISFNYPLVGIKIEDLTPSKLIRVNAFDRWIDIVVNSLLHN